MGAVTGGVATLLEAGCHVGGSVAGGPVGPAGGGYRVEAEQVGQNRWGELAGKVEHGAVAGPVDVDPERPQALGEVGR
jgi:hypothetical protein